MRSLRIGAYTFFSLDCGEYIISGKKRPAVMWMTYSVFPVDWEMWYTLVRETNGGHLNRAGTLDTECVIRCKYFSINTTINDVFKADLIYILSAYVYGLNLQRLIEWF